MPKKEKSEKSTQKKKTKKNALTSVRGMHDVMAPEYYDYQGFFEKAQEIAEYYGFQPITTPILEDVEVFAKGVGQDTDIVEKEMYSFKTKGRDSVVMRPEFTAGVMRAYMEHGMKSLPQPVMLYSYGPLFRHERPQRGRYRQFWQFNMEILGTKKSVADALIIETTLAILRESGAKDLIVDINCIGDRDSRAEYTKELRSFYKKHMNNLSANDRERVKTNPFRVLDSKDPETVAVNEDAPEALCHLSNESKKHFKEVLEFLEEAKIPYRIKKTLVRGLDYYTNTVFEVSERITDENGENERELAITGGGRYNYLATTMGYKKDVPGVGVALGVERIIQSPWWKELDPRNRVKPKVYFIQLGFDAKLKSLPIVETLRKAKIPLKQSLSKDSLSSQLAVAEKAGIPHVLIFGQREALENTVILRNMKTRSQKTISIDKLVKVVKKLK